MKQRLLIFLICFSKLFFGQNPINAYANVTAISGSVLTVNNVNETYHTFEDGNYIVIMQMQDNVIGSNTNSTSATFGNLSAIQSAGRYEIVRILSHTESASLPNSIVLTSNLNGAYNINANASVQIITFRAMGVNYTTTGNIGTLPWNGFVGGVTAMSVTNVFTLAHNITATGTGFRGGVKNSPNNYSACDNSTYASAIGFRYAGKGEGIYKVTNTAFAAGRGKILNGGGGGNDVNAGGGGGGNYSAGGGGGSGWVAAGTGCSPIAGGLGGLSFSTSITGSCIFMGGGGGGGHENDGNGSVGGIGGGIILIKTGTLATTSCAGVSIVSNGVAGANVTNDGAGGGGAGGTIVLNVNSFSVAGACPLTISASGGAGGNSNASSAGAHGGGGGGGQGAIIYSSALPTSNVTTSTSAGTGGVSCGGCSSSLNGSVGTGTTNSGVVVSSPTPLPVDLISFFGYENLEGNVLLNWKTAVEKNSRQFIVQRMNSNASVVDLGILPSTGNNSQYHFTDLNPEKGLNYYRLKQEDIDGVTEFKPWINIFVNGNSDGELLVYPNPVEHNTELKISWSGLILNEIVIVDGCSMVHFQDNDFSSTESLKKINIGQLKAGLYILKVHAGNKWVCKKLIVL